MKTQQIRLEENHNPDLETSLAAKAMQSLIKAENVSFAYPSTEYGKENIQAVKEASLQVVQGQHVTILGRNGSGKSTLAKMINGLELPDEGQVLVFGKNTLDEEQIWAIRQSCGMVFQNPDNQIVGTTVEEDVAFGPENLGITSSEIRKRVDRTLARVGLSEYALKSPSQLSGGQKQKLAIAGILAMEPTCIILDEATSMLDPRASHEFMTLIQKFKIENDLTIIDITHDIENTIYADYIYIMQEGEIYFSGSPREVFTKPDKILSAGLELPQHLLIYYLFRSHFDLEALEQVKAKFAKGIFTPEETARALYLMSQYDMVEYPKHKHNNKKLAQTSRPKEEEALIRVEDLSFSYQKGTSLELKALDDISFTINQGELIAVTGHSGSGKSTLISHLNGLIRPQTGEVSVMGLNTSDKKQIRKIRQHLGLLFQYPEHQLFENTVYDDIAFGPKQFGVEGQQLEKNIKQAIEIVNLDQEILSRSPFELSGGQQRRVAIAGVIAMDCDIYVLDEPAAGLDPIGKREILDYIVELKKLGKTVILVTHDMTLVAEIADRVMVLNQGRLVGFDSVEKIFSNSSLLKKAGLKEPAAYDFARILSKQFNKNILGFTVEQVKANLLTSLTKSEGKLNE